MTGGRVLRIWLLVVLIGSVFLVANEPFDHLGYDLCLAIAVAVALVVPLVAAARIAERRRTKEGRRQSGMEYALGHFVSLAFSGLAIALVPLVAVLVRGIWAPRCDLGAGFLWYLAIPLVTVVYAAAIGVVSSLLARGPVSAVTMAYGFVFVTLLLAARHVIVEPPTFFYNGVLGYVPGPIYDERVTMAPPLGWSRLGALSMAGLLVWFAAATVDTRRHRIHPVQLFELDLSPEGLTPRAGFVVSAIVLVVLHANRQELGVAPDARSIRARLGGRVETENFVVYFDPSSMDSSAVGLLVDDHEFRLAEILRALDLAENPLDEKIESYVYPSPDVKKSLMGARRTSYADPFDRAIHLNDEPFPHPVLKHELTHVVSGSFAGRLGFNPRMGIHEGLAVAVDWDDDRLTPHEWAAVMKQESLLPDLGRVMSSLRFWTMPASRAYLAAGSFMRHLIDAHGSEAVLAFFRDGAFERHFGATFAELEEGWLAALDVVPIAEADRAFARTRLERGSIFDRPCPRLAAELSEEAWGLNRAGHPRAALAAFERLLAFAPDDPWSQLGKLRSLAALEGGDEAIAYGRTLVRSGGTSARVATAAHQLLGDFAWLKGDTGAAREHFRAVVEGGADEDAFRAAELKLAVLEEPVYRDILSDAGSRTGDVATLGRLAVWGPERGLASYLLGRRFRAEGAWREAEEQLATASSLLLPAPSVTIECLRLLGEARYRLGDTAGTEVAFRQLFARGRRPAEVARASSWIDRSLWKRGLPLERAAGGAGVAPQESMPAIASPDAVDGIGG